MAANQIWQILMLLSGKKKQGYTAEILLKHSEWEVSDV